MTDESIWSFDNPNLVSDVASWSIVAPQIYAVALGVLLIAMAIITCVLSCCRGSCCFCCMKPVQITPEEATKEELEAMEKAKKQINVRDVLDEQAQCEDMNLDFES